VKRVGADDRLGGRRDSDHRQTALPAVERWLVSPDGSSGGRDRQAGRAARPRSGVAPSGCAGRATLHGSAAVGDAITPARSARRRQ
jgi:hypothetical protein